MIRSKLLVMCVCPALAAPPAILALSPPARHAMAHVLHRAANHLDHHETPVPGQRQFAIVPCAPSLAAADYGLPVVSSGSGDIGGIGGPHLFSSLGDTADSSGPGQATLRSGGYAGGGGGYIGEGGGGSPGLTSGPTISGVSVLPVTFTIPGLQLISNPSNSASPTPEPAAWLLMVAGFGIVGCAVRLKRRPPLPCPERAR